MKAPLPPLPPGTEQDRKLANAVGTVLERTRREFEQSSQEVEFRKWCVAEAVKICCAQNGNLAELTQFIYTFCHEPMNKFSSPPNQA